MATKAQEQTARLTAEAQLIVRRAFDQDRAQRYATGRRGAPDAATWQRYYASRQQILGLIRDTADAHDVAPWLLAASILTELAMRRTGAITDSEAHDRALALLGLWLEAEEAQSDGFAAAETQAA